MPLTGPALPYQSSTTKSVARSGAIRRTSSFVISLGADRRPGATFAEQSTELSLTNLFELSSRSVGLVKLDLICARLAVVTPRMRKPLVAVKKHLKTFSVSGHNPEGNY